MAEGTGPSAGHCAGVSPAGRTEMGKALLHLEGSNVILLQGFKDTCAILFTKGALLKDPEGVLEKPGENTQSARRIQFTDVRQIDALAATIRAYILEAVEAEKAGLEVTFKKTEDFAVPEEFQRRLDSDPALKTAFEALTPGRQRGYLLHFASAKQSSTRASRVEKCIPRIMEGLGMHDR